MVIPTRLPSKNLPEMAETIDPRQLAIEARLQALQSHEAHPRALQAKIPEYKYLRLEDERLDYLTRRHSHKAGAIFYIVEALLIVILEIVVVWPIWQEMPILALGLIGAASLIGVGSDFMLTRCLINRCSDPDTNQDALSPLSKVLAIFAAPCKRFRSLLLFTLNSCAKLKVKALNHCLLGNPRCKWVNIGDYLEIPLTSKQWFFANKST